MKPPKTASCFFIFSLMTTQSPLKSASKAAVATLLLLLIGALVFWRQRALFVDDAYIPSLIINDHQLHIQESRYGSFITHLVPLFGSWMHLSLKAILIGYTLSFTLFYLAVILLLVYRYKQYALGVLMGIYYTVFVSDGFFWTNNEVHQGIAWMFLCLGIIFWKGERGVKASWQYAATIILFGGLAIFTHPLVGLVLLYLVAFMWLNKHHWPFDKKQSIVISVLFLLIFALKFFISQSGDSYDAEKLHSITHLTLPQILHTFRGDAADSFFQDCKTGYWWIFIIIILGLVAMIREKKYWSTALTIIGSVAYFVFVCLVYGDAYDFHTKFYMESEWMGFSVLLSAPFVFYFLPLLDSKKAVILVSLIFATRLVYIGSASQRFTARLDYISKSLDQMGKKGLTKVILKKDQKVEDALVMVWGMPIESMMTDAMNGVRPQRTIIVLPEDWIKDRYTPAKDTMIASFNNVKKTELNPHYFSIDTTQEYKILSGDEFWAQ
jgi:hypothetical protein